MNFAEWLDDRLNQPDRTAADLARLLGLGSDVVSKMRKGIRQPKAHELPKIEDYLGELSPLTTTVERTSTDTRAGSLTPEEMASAARQLRGSMSREGFAKALGYSGSSSWQRYEEAETYRKAPILPRQVTHAVERWLTAGGRPRIDDLLLDKFLGRRPQDPSRLVPSPAAQRAQANASTPERVDFGHQRLPVYGQAVGGEEGRFVLNGQKVADVLAPAFLDGVPNAYAVYVHGESMLPKYEPGQTVWIDPNRPVGPNNFVVVQILADSDDEPPFGYVKRFVKLTTKDLVLEQLNPPEGGEQLMRFPRDRVVSVHKIVGSAEI